MGKGYGLRSTASKAGIQLYGQKRRWDSEYPGESSVHQCGDSIDWNQTEMKKVGNYQLKVTAQAIPRQGLCHRQSVLPHAELGRSEALRRRSGALA